MKPLRGEVPDDLVCRPGFGYGSGVGHGYGNGSGNGSGHGNGSGIGNGSGSGYGIGSGYGLGSGGGSGIGNGSGNGNGYGSNYGYVYDGYTGNGHGNSDNICKVTNHTKVTITTEKLIQLDACSKGIEKFQEHFPKGATWPDDVAKATKLGLNEYVPWLVKELGLLAATKTEN